MIRVILSGSTHAYGYDVTGWEYEYPNSTDLSLLDLDLLERVEDGDIVMFFNTSDNAKEWCENNDYIYEFLNDE